MEDKYKKLFKNIAYLTISNFASRILVFLLVPLYTSVLSTKEYGSYDAVVTTMQILAPIVIANISDGVMRFLLDSKQKEDQVIKIGFKFICIGIGIIGVLLIFNRLSGLISFLNGYEVYALLYSIVFILYNYGAQFAKGLNKVSFMATAGFISTLVILLCNIVFLLIFKLGLSGFYFANILGLGAPVIYYAIMLRPWKKINRIKIDNNVQKDMLAYSLPLIFNTIGWTINSSLDKYCVIYFYDVAESGILAVSYKIPTILSVLYSIFTQAWQISAVTEYENKDRKEFYSKTFLTVNAIGALGCALLIVLNRVLAVFLFNKEFFIAWKYVPFLLLSAMFNQTAGFIGPLLSAKKESKAMAVAAVWGTITNLVFNIVLIIMLGVQGAAIATAISSFVIFFVRWWYARDLLESYIYIQLYLSWIILLISAISEIFEVPYFIQGISFFAILIINYKQVKSIIQMIFKKCFNKRREKNDN